MKNWLLSVHSDGTEDFLSTKSPCLGEKVCIRIRMYEDSPVKNVFLLYFPNGEDYYIEMKKAKVEHGLAYYAAEITVTEKRMPYRFVLACDDVIYYYNQKEITTYFPDNTRDFVLITDYKAPEWVADSVFYQIFPERFCNGNKENDVENGEFTENGFPSKKIENWDSVPEDYEHARCLDFYGGDLEGITEKIPYLKELGVSALYLNPIFTSPSVHKFDCIDYFHVDPHFGGDEALEKLSAALHKNGMRLILDISINHTGTDHKWFNRDGIRFDKSVGAYNNPDSEERSFYFFGENNSYLGWFNLETMPTLNYTSSALREKIYRGEDSVIRKWLKPPYNIDGWRFDVADVFARNNEIQLDKELWPEICGSIRSEKPDAYILAEDWGDCSEHLQGDQWDSPMNYYSCARVIRSFLGQPDFFAGRNEILSSIRYKMTADDLKNRVLNHFSKIPFPLWQSQFNLIGSHDVSRLYNDPTISFGQYKSAVIFQFMLAGTPSVYYGDEAETSGTCDSMEGCRYPMPWNRDFKETRNYKLYSKIIKLRNSEKTLRRGGMKFLYSEGRVFAIARFLGEKVFVAVISGEDEDVKINLPLGAIGAKTPETEVFGSGLDFSVSGENSVEISVKANSAILFSCTML